jgi:Uma2 family endonuclease
MDFRDALDHLPEGTTLVAVDVPWEEYERLLEELADRPGVRVTYDEGRLEIMSPRPEHEEYKRFIEKIIDALGEHMDLNVEPRGSATWKKKQASKGTEPDTCYYIANAERIIGRRTIDLSKDPAPDLVVEIDVTTESISKFPIYSALGVPEIWLYDVKHNHVTMYELRETQYVHAPSSRSFPVLTGEALAGFIEQSKLHGQRAAMAAFRRWLKK